MSHPVHSTQRALGYKGAPLEQTDLLGLDANGTVVVVVPVATTDHPFGWLKDGTKKAAAADLRLARQQYNRQTGE